MLKRKLALKRLTASDLTIFKWHFENKNAGNQKAINLNRNIFIDQLYPALPEAAAEQDGRFPLDLRIYGPDGKPELNLQRKIIKHGAYKNWRLNGEFINNPSDDPDRFNELEAGDFVILDFSGGVIPVSATMLFIGSKSVKDKSLYQSLNARIGNRKMVLLLESELDQIISESLISQDHPFNNVNIDDALEDVVLGGPEAIERIWKGVSGRVVSHETLDRARRKAEGNGKIGEQLIHDYLVGLQKTGELHEVEWTSEEVNPVAPYDFKIRSNEENILIDVKSTDGEFGRRLHVSMNEVRQMANGAERYDLYRVYEIEETEAKFRVASDIRSFAQSVLDALKNLPEGVTPNGFTFNPGKLVFDEEKIIEYPDEDVD